MKKDSNLIEKSFSQKVIGLKGSLYEGLIGKINLKNVYERTDNSVEQVYIVVDFEPSDYMCIVESHPHLERELIKGVYCNKNELGFFKNENDEFSFTWDGKVVCPRCYSGLNSVVETQYDDITWLWDVSEGRYRKVSSRGTNGKICPLCYGIIQDKEKFLVY
jgi:hypothetical protein